MTKRNWPFVFVLAAVAVAIFAGNSVLGAAEAESEGLTELRDVLAKSADSSEVGSVYNRVFPTLSEADLEKLSRDPNTSLALQAYAELHTNWRKVERPKYDSYEYLLPARDKQRFLGFLAGRTGLTPPKGWEKAYGKEWTGETFKYRESSLGEKLDLGILRVPKGTEIRERDGAIEVRIGDAACSFPMEIIDVLNTNDDWVSRGCASISGDVGLLALYDATGPCFLYCVRNGELRWQTVAWGPGSPPLFGMTGYWSHNVEIVVGDDYVALFGSGTGGPCVEVFDLETGKSRFRYSREYWSQRSPVSFADGESED
jgi:hypothetical protein